jgi:hypothetical protein
MLRSKVDQQGTLRHPPTESRCTNVPRERERERERQNLLPADIHQGGFNCAIDITVKMVMDKKTAVDDRLEGLLPVPHHVQSSNCVESGR